MTSVQPEGDHRNELSESPNSRSTEGSATPTDETSGESKTVTHHKHQPPMDPHPINPYQVSPGRPTAHIVSTKIISIPII